MVPQTLAYSYIRFSHPDQAAGDSLRRQTEASADWCRRNGARLDTSVTLHDLGRSAYLGEHRKNPDRNALAGFLRLVEDGKVPPGSILVIENLDRLSREEEVPACHLLTGILLAGIRVVQLKPSELVLTDKSNGFDIMRAVMELSRGHGESAIKSERVGDAWAEKRRAAASDKQPQTERLPAWLSLVGRRRHGKHRVGGRFVVDEAKANTVRRIYRMAAEGYGIGIIAKRLNAERVPPIGRASYWARSYVAKLLASRVPAGECQPFTRRGGGKRRPDGEPIPGYFPAIVTDDEWHAARAALTSRRLKGGRPARTMNLFSGLLRDARNGGRMHRVHKGKKSSGCLLASYRATMGVGGATSPTFPFAALEQSILGRLREIDPREILPHDDGAADLVLALTAKVAAIDARMEKVKAMAVAVDAEGPELADDLGDVLARLRAQRNAVAGQLAEANRQAASPLAAAWGDCRSLLEVIEQAPDREDARVRLRSALRRMVEGIWCLFVARGALRIAAVRVQFTGGRHRDYLIVYKPPTGGSVGERPARTWVRSFAELGAGEGLDLRKREHAAALADALEAIDPEDLK